MRRTVGSEDRGSNLSRRARVTFKLSLTVRGNLPQNRDLSESMKRRDLLAMLSGPVANQLSTC